MLFTFAQQFFPNGNLQSLTWVMWIMLTWKPSHSWTRSMSVVTNHIYCPATQISPRYLAFRSRHSSHQSSFSFYSTINNVSNKDLHLNIATAEDMHEVGGVMAATLMQQLSVMLPATTLVPPCKAKSEHSSTGTRLQLKSSSSLPAELLHKSSSDNKISSTAIASISTDMSPSSGVLFCLQGDLGAGKTAFARGFVAAWTGCPTLRVTSPTYLLAHSYPSWDPQKYPEYVHIKVHANYAYSISLPVNGAESASLNISVSVPGSTFDTSFK
jgi:hypothetical protein